MFAAAAVRPSLLVFISEIGKQATLPPAVWHGIVDHLKY